MIDQQLEHHVTPLRIDKDFDFIRNMKILTIKMVRIQALSIDTLSNLRGILKDTALQLERIRFHEQFLCNEISRRLVSLLFPVSSPTRVEHRVSIGLIENLNLLAGIL